MNSFWQYVNGKWEFVSGSPGDKEGYYYLESDDAAAPMRPIYSKGDGHFEYLEYENTNKVIDSDGNLHEFSGTNGVHRSYSKISSETSGNISNENVPNFKPSSAPTTNTSADDKNTLHTGQSLFPGQELKSEDGKYTFQVTDNQLKIVGPDGRMWVQNVDGISSVTVNGHGIDVQVKGPYGSYSGWSTDFGLEDIVDVKLVDGKLVATDKDGKQHTLFEGDKGKHWFLVDFDRPRGTTSKLFDTVRDTVKKSMQTQVDLLGSGGGTQMPDLATIMTKEDLPDPTKSDNKGKMIDAYNENRDQFQQVQSEMEKWQEKVNLISVTDIPDRIEQARDKIEDHIIDDLNEKLRAADIDYTWKDGKEGGTIESAAVTRDSEQKLIDALLDAGTAVDKEVKAVHDFFEKKKEEVKKSKPAAPKRTGADDSGDNNSNNGNNNNGSNNSSNNNNAADNVMSTDWGDSYKDLLTNGEKGGADDTTSESAGDTAATTGASNGNSAILNAINSAIDKVEASGQKSSSNNGGSNNRGSNNGGGSNSNSGNSTAGLMQAMQMMSLISSMNQGKNGKGKDTGDDESRYRDRVGESGAAQAVQASAANPAQMTDSGLVSASPATPPQLSTTGKANVDMRLPDGSTQKVSSAVAQAVNKELNNPNGSDARAAYSGTGADISRGTPVGNSDLHTGDVATWSDRSGNVVATGVLVVDGSGLHMISSGHLVNLDTDNPPYGGHDDYTFSGFVRPADGTVAVAATDAAPAAPGAVTAPPSAPAAPPAVSAPTAVI
ncbi:hypothetical protein ACW2Q0_03830 [Nocardia sp. R16R-3T]